MWDTVMNANLNSLEFKPKLVGINWREGRTAPHGSRLKVTALGDSLRDHRNIKLFYLQCSGVSPTMWANCHSLISHSQRLTKLQLCFDSSYNLLFCVPCWVRTIHLAALMVLKQNEVEQNFVAQLSWRWGYLGYCLKKWKSIQTWELLTSLQLCRYWDQCSWVKLKVWELFCVFCHGPVSLGRQWGVSARCLL